MSFRDKSAGTTDCHLRSACKAESDKMFFNSMFESEWEVFVIREDPVTGNFKGETICCDAALPPMGYKVPASAALQ